MSKDESRMESKENKAAEEVAKDESTMEEKKENKTPEEAETTAKSKEELVFLQRAYVNNMTLSLHTAIRRGGSCPLCFAWRPITLRRRLQMNARGQLPGRPPTRRSARVARRRIMRQAYCNSRYRSYRRWMR
jgi:chromatin remodeling complex protein RSC6